MSRKILGLDIRNHGLTALQLGRGVKGHWIEDVRHVPFPSRQDTNESIYQALETVCERMDISGALCMAAIPAREFSFRALDVPFRNTKKIRQILPFELEPTLPFPVEELVIDFHPASYTQARDRSAVFAGAIEKSTLASYLKILGTFDISPETVTFSGFPVVSYLMRQADDPAPFILADIDPDGCTLFFVSNNDLCYIRSFRLPRPDVTEADMLCTQIRRTICAFADTSGIEFKPLRLMVTGDGSRQVGLINKMAQTLDMSVVEIDLAKNTPENPESNPPQALHPSQINSAFALAVMGTMGTKSFNFNRGAFGTGRKWSEHKHGFLRTGILVGIAGAVALTSLVMETHTLGKKVTGLNQQITDIFRATFPEVKKIVDPVHQMQLKIEDAQKNNLMPANPESQVRKVDILNEISRRIPENIDVEFTKMVMGSESVMITGNTDTFNSVDDMKNRMETVEWFKKVTINSANISRSTNRVDFKLKVQL